MTGAPRNGALAAHLRRRIRAEGPLTVAAFMAEALGHPEHGYYVTADRLGAAGDFVTAPEISQMFGELIGLWCADTWARLGAPAPVALAELGPGRGTLMADALRALRVVPAFRAALSLHLVETSPVFRRLQALRLGEVAQPVWHDDVGTLPDGPLLVIANEFFDALPIRQFQKTAHGWVERCVGLVPAGDDGAGENGEIGAGGADEPGFRFVLDPRPGLGRLLVPAAVRDAPVGSVVELAPAAQAIARTLAERVVRHGGAVLIIDYAYQGPRLGTTLQAVRGHRPVPVLEAPGLADLTAHVDFGALSEAALAVGAEVHGPVSQADFLLALGIEARAERLRARAGAADRAAVDAACARLIGTGAMGTLFQVVVITGSGTGPLAGFAAP